MTTIQDIDRLVGIGDVRRDATKALTAALCPTWDGGPRLILPEILAERDRRSPIPLARASVSAIDVQAREIKQLAWHLLRRSVDPHLALELLIAFNTHRGMPPLEQHEVEALVATVANYESRRKFSNAS
jgi:hypothetical protein